MSCRSAVTLKILTNTLPYNLDYSRILKKNIIIYSARSGTVYDGMAYRHFSWVGVSIPALFFSTSTTDEGSFIRNAKEQGGSYTGIHYFKLYPSDRASWNLCSLKKSEGAWPRIKPMLRGKATSILPGWAHKGMTQYIEGSFTVQEHSTCFGHASSLLSYMLTQCEI